MLIFLQFSRIAIFDSALTIMLSLTKLSKPLLTPSFKLHQESKTISCLSSFSDPILTMLVHCSDLLERFLHQDPAFIQMYTQWLHHILYLHTLTFCLCVL